MSKRDKIIFCVAVVMSFAIGAVISNARADEWLDGVRQNAFNHTPTGYTSEYRDGNGRTLVLEIVRDVGECRQVRETLFYNGREVAQSTLTLCRPRQGVTARSQYYIGPPDELTPPAPQYRYTPPVAPQYRYAVPAPMMVPQYHTPPQMAHNHADNGAANLLAGVVLGVVIDRAISGGGGFGFGRNHSRNPGVQGAYHRGVSDRLRERQRELERDAYDQGRGRW